jgi:osmotically-inducible protein OsmY
MIAGVRGVDTSNLEIDWRLHDEMRRSPLFVVKSDRTIKNAVKDVLSYDPRISSADIMVTSSNGTVTLTGTVGNLRAKRAAEEGAENTIGVWKVRNRLKVRPGESPSDEYIGRQVEQSFARDALLEPYKLTVLVRNQRVHLYGEVLTYHARTRAEDVAAGVFGVAAVANHIDVTTNPTKQSDARIEEEINDQFFWSVVVDGGDIHVNVEDGVATLRGTVDSWHELKAVVENAFQAGAEAVENHLNVVGSPSNIYPQQYYPSLF